MRRLLGSLLLFSFLAASTQAGEAPAAGFRDDFKVDSRARYRSQGDVTWQPGRLRLADRGAFIRAVAPGATAVVRAAVRFEKGDDGVFLMALTKDKTRVALGLRLNMGKVALACSGDPNRPVVLAQSADDLPRSWLVRVELNYGLARFKAWRDGAAEPGDWQGAHYLGAAFWEPQALVVQVGNLTPVTLSSLSVTGPGPLRLDEDRQRHYAQALDVTKRAMALGREGKAALALPLFREANASLEKALPVGHLLLGVNLANQGRMLQDAGDQLAAGPPLRRALAIAALALPPDHPDLASCRTALAGTVLAEGKLDEARSLLENALAAEKKVLPPVHLLTAITLHNLAVVHDTQGRMKEARACAEQAYAIRRKTLSPDHPDLAHSLDMLGNLLEEEDRPEEALAHVERGLALRRKALPPGHPDLARSLANLGRLLGARGNYKAAEAHLQEALALLEKALPPDNPHTAICLNNLGMVLYEQGKLPQARASLEQALAIRRKVLPPDHYDLASSHNVLGFIFLEQGDLQQARKHLERALAINEKALPPLHPHTAVALNELGGVLRQLGRTDEAERYIARALAMQKELLGPDHLSLAVTLNNLALLLRERKRYAEARECLERAVAIQAKSLSPWHPLTARSRHNLGRVLFEERRLDEARTQLEQALADGRKALPSLHPQIISGTDALAYVRQFDRDTAGAWRLFAEAADLRTAFLAHTLTGTAAREHAPLARVLRLPLDNLVSLAVQTPDLDAARRRQLLHAVLDGKALSATALTRRQEALVVQATPALQKEHARLRQLRQRLADLLVQDVRRGPEEHRRLCEDLQREQDDLERTLGEQVRAYADVQQAARGGPAQLAERLGRGTVLVELIRYLHIDLPPGEFPRGLEDRYAALLLWQDAEKRPAVRVVPLGPALPLEQLVHAWRGEVQKGGSGAGAGRKLRAALWEPLARLLPKGTERLLVAPDGELALLPWEALPLADDAYLVERYAVRYLSSGRDLMPRPLPTAKSEVALVLADPAYDAGAGDGKPVTAGGGARLRAGEELLQGLRFRSLPGFAREADAVARLLEGRAGWKVEAVRRTEASEERLARAARPRLLYCVTHGFFLKDLERPPAGQGLRDLDLGGVGPARPRLPHFGADPRLRSGLALAGANQWQERSAKGLSDGLLTALEVENLDLWGTELVVLSACETGLGEVQVGEGLLGLRRAFQLAGAQAVVASLWKVPDAETEQLMTAFLSRWLKGEGKGEALRQAQLDMIRTLRASASASRRAAPPLYWAGFICHGQAN